MSIEYFKTKDFDRSADAAIQGGGRGQKSQSESEQFSVAWIAQIPSKEFLLSLVQALRVVCNDLGVMDRSTECRNTASG
jgi:hypothetical protein